MTQRLKEQFKGLINPGAGFCKDKQKLQIFKQTNQEKKMTQINKIRNERGEIRTKQQK